MAVLYLSAAGAVACLVGIIWMAMSSPDSDKKTPKKAETPASTANAQGPSAAGAVDDLLTPDIVPSQDAAPGDPPLDAPAETPKKEAAAKKSEPKATQVGEGAEGKRWNDLPKFEPVAGTPEEDLAAIQELINTAIDPEATVEANRARFALETKGKAAVPLLINQLIAIDTDGTDNDIRAGKSMHETLKALTGQLGDDSWPNDTTQRDGYLRSAIRKRWFNWWTKNSATWAGRSDSEEDH